MTGFIAAAAATVAVVLALLMRPFFGRVAAGQASRRQLNAAIYRDQFGKLDQDLAEGTLRQEDYAQARAELQRRMLEDNQVDDTAEVIRAPRRTMIAVALALPIAAGAFYLVIGHPDGLQPGAAAVAGHGEQPTAQDLERMIATLAAKLQQEPTNYQGWAMLARSYKVMGRTADAEKAFERAGSFIDDDAQMLASYADVVATNAGGSLAGKPTQLIQKALKVDPQNPMALWLSGTADLEKKNYAGALRTWDQLAALLPPGSEDAKMLEGAINDVRAKSGLPPEASKPVAVASGASISGIVELDPAIKDKASPNDTIMIIARLPGTRMPLAVLRKSASELPLKFTLDDSLSMNPASKLSAAPEVEIEARISKTGLAKPESGDLVSAAQTTKIGAKGLALRVAKVLP